MGKVNRARALLVAALCAPVIATAACVPFGHPVLVSTSPGHQSFTISGNLTGLLAPGLPPNPLNLVLRNPNKQPLSVASLKVYVTGTSAGRACGAANFGVAQYRGLYPLHVGARQTVSLRQLGVPTALLPHVSLIDLKSNQDACKHVTVYLSYAGSGSGSGK